MTGSADVAIIGGGVIGLTTAYYLARDKVRVVLMDQGDLGQEASWAGAGILPPPSPAPSNDAWQELHRRSFHLFPGLSAELRHRTGIDNGYRVCGGLEFEAAMNSGHAGEWRPDGSHELYLEEDQLRQREPEIASGTGRAVYLPDLAQVRNPWHVRALVETNRLLGVDLRSRCAVRSLKMEGDRCQAAETDVGPVRAGCFLAAAGAWTGGLLLPLRLEIPIKPIRGQIVLVNPGRPLLRSVLLWGSSYLVPREEGRILIGSTEEDVGFDKATTPQAIERLLSLGRRLVPALAQSQPEKCWAGLRPGTPDARPCLGRIPGTANVWVAAGHFRSGIQLSPGTGQVCAELLKGERPSLSLESLRPDRFSAPRTGLAFLR